MHSCYSQNSYYKKLPPPISIINEIKVENQENSKKKIKEEVCTKPETVIHNQSRVEKNQGSATIITMHTTYAKKP